MGTETLLGLMIRRDRAGGGGASALRPGQRGPEHMAKGVRQANCGVKENWEHRHRAAFRTRGSRFEPARVAGLSRQSQPIAHF